MFRWGRSAFDVAPANRVLNALAAKVGLDYDRDGLLAAAGSVDAEVLGRLDGLAYYGMGYPKSLANEFGLVEVLPIDSGRGVAREDGLRTYTNTCGADRAGGGKVGLAGVEGNGDAGAPVKMLVTGVGRTMVSWWGGCGRGWRSLGWRWWCRRMAIVDYKEALVMGVDRGFAVAGGEQRPCVGDGGEPGQYRRCGVDRSGGVILGKIFRDWEAGAALAG